MICWLTLWANTQVTETDRYQAPNTWKFFHNIKNVWELWCIFEHWSTYGSNHIHPRNPGRYCVSYITWLIKSWRGGERKPCTFPAMGRAAKYANQPASVEYPSDNKGQSRTAHNKQESSFPGWKLDTYAGNRLTWHEWYGKFHSAVDSTQLSQDVKLTCLKTWMIGKARAVNANFAYCGALYTGALNTLEKYSSQP